MSKLSYKAQRYIILFSFLLIPLTLLVTFTYYPATQLFYYSFTSWDGLSPEKNWVGLGNYKEIFSSSDMFKVFGTSIYYFIGGLVQLALALYFAVILNSKVRGKNFFKATLFLPFIMNSVAIALIFTVFFDPKGTLNSFLTLLGLEYWKQSWLGNPDLINYSLAFTSIWRYMGLNLIIFFGVLQSIPQDVYEAAKIDGASEWQQFRYITLPSIRRILELNMILTISGAISVFEIPFIMTKGANGSMTFVIQTVDTAFRFSNIGLASAMAIVLLAVVVVVISLQRILLKERD
ncbi:sugar ABC transporter permease [Ectobacillus sp. JY-23]|uniref:carbohydrate ABC transporter permease n=1 Tax=Ectobacillus sp. JY-23 TaxID=2933872 RepID=UPI001FF1040F|nr:sugar ABC transporter permease [Ectobacillus sp. JY-23]UOY92238.1 sugar ABC transporter permease [Ectobacillus sp. JY-23]